MSVGPERTPEILIVGYNAFDVIVPTVGMPPPDSKCEVPGIIVGGGGPGATAAVALAKLGAQVRLVTVMADDLPGRLQLQELQVAGVDVSHSTFVSGALSAKAVILVDPDTGERTIFWSRGDLPLLAAESVQESWLDSADLVYCDGHEPAAALKLATAARRRNLPVVLDAGSVRDGSAELVGVCSDVISSTVFAPQLTSCPEPEQALRALRDRGPARVAMTFGSAGCLALEDDRCRHVPAFEVPVRDTTGAGDVFHAAYAWARAMNQEWIASLEFASAAAALKCRDWGGRRGLADRQEVEQLLVKGRRRTDKPPGFPRGQ